MWSIQNIQHFDCPSMAFPNQVYLIIIANKVFLFVFIRTPKRKTAFWEWWMFIITLELLLYIAIIYKGIQIHKFSTIVQLNSDYHLS